MSGPRHQEFITEFEKGSSFALCGVVRVMDKSLIKKTYAVMAKDVFLSSVQSVENLLVWT
jgi:hypothetical protein